jgi:hypothetical protein
VAMTAIWKMLLDLQAAAHDLHPSAPPAEVEELDAWLHKAYGKVALYPETRMRQGAVEELGEGFMDLLALRNEVPAAASALTSLSLRVKELEEALSTQAAQDVLAERRRQVDKEGWSSGHDDDHCNGELAAAAATYAFSAATACRWYAADPIGFWPWDPSWWKPTTPRRDLVKAGALILAEIERHDRARTVLHGEGE